MISIDPRKKYKTACGYMVQFGGLLNNSTILGHYLASDVTGNPATGWHECEWDLHGKALDPVNPSLNIIGEWPGQ